MKCPNCGFQADDSDMFCTECGRDLRGIKKPTSEKVDPGRPEKESPETVKENSTASNVTSSNVISSVASDQLAQKPCFKCGKFVPYGANHCPYCDASLRGNAGGNGNSKGTGDKNNKTLGIIIASVAGAAILIGGILYGLDIFSKEEPEDVISYDLADAQEITEAATEEIYDKFTGEQTEETEDIAFYNDAVDAIHEESVMITGRIVPSDVGYTLDFGDDPINLCAYTDNGEEQRIEDIQIVNLFAESEEVELEKNKKALVEMEGRFLILNSTPVFFAEDMTVLEKGMDEEAIHTYRIIQEDCTWIEAYNKCLDMGGYLARINSKREFKIIRDQIIEEGKTKMQFYLGARRDTDSSSYYWVDESNEFIGDRLDNGYTDWCSEIWLSGEPSYRDDSLNLDEVCLSMFRYSKTGKWVFNDVPADLIGALSTNKGKVAYICEIE